MNPAAPASSTTSSASSAPTQEHAGGDAASTAQVVNVQSSSEEPQTLAPSTSSAQMASQSDIAQAKGSSAAQETTTENTGTKEASQANNEEQEKKAAESDKEQETSNKASQKGHELESEVADDAWQKLKSEFGEPLAMIEEARKDGFGIVGDDDFSGAMKEKNLRLLETRALLAGILAKNSVETRKDEHGVTNSSQSPQPQKWIREGFEESRSQPNSKIEVLEQAAKKRASSLKGQAVRPARRFAHWAKKELSLQSETVISLVPRKKQTYVASAAATAAWSTNSDTSTAEDSHVSELSDSNSDPELSKAVIHYLKDGKIESKMMVPAQDAFAQLKKMKLGEYALKPDESTEPNSSLTLTAPKVKFAEAKEEPTASTAALQFATPAEASVPDEDTASCAQESASATVNEPTAITSDPANDADDESEAQKEASPPKEKVKAQKIKTKKVKIITLYAKERYSGADVNLELTPGKQFTAYPVTAKDAEDALEQPGVTKSLSKKIKAEHLIAIIYDLQMKGAEKPQPIEVVVEKNELTKAGVDWTVCHDNLNGQDAQS
ncbi:MAG: hypothetical protein ACRC24_08000 [Vibrionaceae bacterium]